MSSELVQIEFNGEVLEAIQTTDRKVWVHVRRICDVLGLDPDSQRKRLADPVRCPWATTVIMTVVASDGKNRDCFCLDLDGLPMWLATIEVSRISDDLRPKVIAYQKECAKVLRDHFFGRGSTGDAILDSIDLTRKALEAIAGTRRRQLELEKAQAETHVLAEDAHRVAVAALNQSTMNHGHFTVLGYSQLMEREMPYSQAIQHGRALSGICRARGLQIGKMRCPRFGSVNTYPESVLREYFGDTGNEGIVPFPGVAS